LQYLCRRLVVQRPTRRTVGSNLELTVRCLQVSTTSLSEEGLCDSTLAELTAALRTREKYSTDPVLDSDVEQLVSVTSRWIDDCPHTTPVLRHADRLISLLRVADLIFGHSDVSWSSSSFCRSHRSVSYFSNMVKWSARFYTTFSEI